MSDRSASTSSRATHRVCYDIANDRRLRQVRKDHGAPLQFLVFECDVTQREFVQMQRGLKAVVKPNEDQVLSVSPGPAERRGDRVISSLGLPCSQYDAPCYVV